MTIDLSELKGLFFEEASEHLGTMETTLLALEHQPDDRELLNQVFRAAHSIKGGSGTFGFDDLRRLTHALEGLLHLLRDGVVSLTPTLADLLLRSTDVLGAVIVSTRQGEPPPEAIELVLAEIERATPKGAEAEGAEQEEAASTEIPWPSPAEPAVRRTFRVVFAPGPNLFRQGMDPLLVVRDLAELGEPLEVVVDTSALPDLDELDPETCYLAWSMTLATERSEADIRDVFAFVEDSSRIEVTVLDPPGEPESDPAPASDDMSQPVAKEPPAHAAGSAQAVPALLGGGKHPLAASASTVRVDTEKLDRLIDLVGELVIAQSMVTSAMNDVRTAGADERLRDAVLAMDRNTKELQDRVMAVRMVPIGSVFNRFPRMVRDLGASLGKRSALVVTGDDVELDKGMVEKIADPLTHLVRNAVDHGIESPAERRAAGKPEEGTISIVAVHQGGGVVIEVRDDGRGLPTQRILDKARKLGLVAPDAEPTIEEIHALIFAAGFSTKDEVSDVSGRGVGMDVVKRNVEALNGSIAFTSDPGKGSRMRIRLPLTMAIIDGLTLRVGAQVFVLPLIEVVESLRPTRSQYQTVLGRGEVIRLRDQAIPLLRLHQALGVPDAEIDPCRALVCIVETPTTPVGLLVDEILGQAQVVVKTLETNFRRVEGVMGATILGDGRVALILDAQAIARKASVAGHEKEAVHDADQRVA